MHDPNNSPVTLTSVPNDLEAAMIVSTLAAHEVDATTAGEFTSGFRAEAPGEVKVLVRERDLERARDVLGELVAEQSAEQEPPASATNSAMLRSHRLLKFVAWAILFLLGIGILQNFL